MEECLINLNKGDGDEGCLKFCNILKWSTTVQGKLVKGCLESIVRYNSIVCYDKYERAMTVSKMVIHPGRRPPKF